MTLRRALGQPWANGGRGQCRHQEIHTRASPDELPMGARGRSENE